MSERERASADRLRFEGVSKAFARRHLAPFLLRDLFGTAAGGRDETDVFWALRDASFTVAEGEAVALLGRNGSGKSTSLSLVAGSLRPTEGRVSVRGRVAPLLALGVGFEPDMTAPENALVNASLLGVPPEQMEERIDEILAFAELADFVDVPVRHYSTGMVARLGMGVALHVDADVVLIDEVLAVGDGAFQQKCLARVRALRDDGATLLLVTHELGLARELCNRAVWLREGRVEAHDDVEAVADEYSRFLASC